jgi:hypothetical protein
MITFRPLLLCSTLLVATLTQSGTVSDAISIETWLSNAEAIKSATARKALSDFRRDVSDLDAEYSKGFEKARSVLSTKLDKARAEATRNEKVDDAVKIRESLEDLKDVGVSRVSKSKTPGAAINGDLRIVVGRWQGVWGTTGNRLLITISEDGTLVYEADQLKLAMQNNRLLAIGAVHQNFEIIPSGSRLIVLGWTVPSQRNPLTDQPDHVAILSRAN